MLFPLQTFSIQLFVFDYFTSLLSIVDFTFPSNSRVGTIQCLTITVINDNVYEESLVLTVTLSKNLMMNQGRMDLGNTETTVTTNDDDGENNNYSITL